MNINDLHYDETLFDVEYDKAGSPLPEYPRPQWQRDEWINLNGEWEFAFDHGKSGEARGMESEGDFPEKILVPFCPESPLSGINHKDFMESVWYRRTVELTVPDGKRLLLHFGAVDYEAKVWLNGTCIGSHRGGYTPFSFDITDHVLDGENTLVVNALDDTRSDLQPRGKQSDRYESYAVSYTRTTGIWQTVWIETVPDEYLKKARITPQAAAGQVHVAVEVEGLKRKAELVLEARYESQLVGQLKVPAVGGFVTASLQLDEVHLWEPGAPALYDLTLSLVDAESGETIDMVESYFGLRDLTWDKHGLYINGKPLFMRLVLDQGFNPAGIYTAPSDRFLREEIERAMVLGFNGARFHQRVFEPRAMYWADRLGYLVWGEFANEFRLSDMEGIKHFLPQWLDVIERDYNHPSIIGWCPLNESYHAMKLDMDTHTLMYRITKETDRTRPVIDASGGWHVDTDFFDVHDYEQDPEKLAADLAPMLEDSDYAHVPIERYLGRAPRLDYPYRGQAYWVSEYGGTYKQPLDAAENSGWGYGSVPADEEEFVERFVGLTKVLLDNPRVCGFCYTQLTDIEQEQNGLYGYDRSPKFSASSYERMRDANQAVAGFEEKNGNGG